MKQDDSKSAAEVKSTKSGHASSYEATNSIKKTDRLDNRNSVASKENQNSEKGNLPFTTNPSRASLSDRPAKEKLLRPSKVKAVVGRVKPVSKREPLLQKKTENKKEEPKKEKTKSLDAKPTRALTSLKQEKTETKNLSAAALRALTKSAPDKSVDGQSVDPEETIPSILLDTPGGSTIKSKDEERNAYLQLLRDGAYPALAAVGSGDCRPPVKDQKQVEDELPEHDAVAAYADVPCAQPSNVILHQQQYINEPPPNFYPPFMFSPYMMSSPPPPLIPFTAGMFSPSPSSYTAGMLLPPPSSYTAGMLLPPPSSYTAGMLTPSYMCPPPASFMAPSLNQHEEGIPAYVDMDGYIRLRLSNSVDVDIAANKAVRVRDGNTHSTLVVSACGLQMAMVHPQGRVLQYGSRIEIQCADEISIKNAKMFPEGISFTANNCTLVYLVDVAGARTTTDMFHDLYDDNIADKLFRDACQLNPKNAADLSSAELEQTEFWRNNRGENCWNFGKEVIVRQKADGLTMVERRSDKEYTHIKASPATGKVRLGNRFANMTASLGEQSHVFVKALERRMHYNGQNKVFTVRNAGHAAGFDETGQLRLF